MNRYSNLRQAMGRGMRRLAANPNKEILNRVKFFQIAAARARRKGGACVRA